jgi:hypothetical protein
MAGAAAGSMTAAPSTPAGRVLGARTLAPRTQRSRIVLSCPSNIRTTGSDGSSSHCSCMPSIRAKTARASISICSSSIGPTSPSSLASRRYLMPRLTTVWYRSTAQFLAGCCGSVASVARVSRSSMSPGSVVW